MAERYAIMLCGGSGTRLWPLSRALRPKQLLALNGSQTLLQQTALRLCRHVQPENLITVTNEEQRFEVKGQLAEVLPLAVDGVMLEPCARNTLPAIAWAVDAIYKKDPHAIIGVFPSDHAINNEAAFLQAWATAEQAARQGYLTLLGIQPTEPATGYGYIQPTATFVPGAINAFEVQQFVEKPDAVKAQKFLEANYLWNSGMFVFQANVFTQQLAHFQPELSAAIDKLNATTLRQQYSKLSNISIDYGLAELAEKVAVVPVNMEWNDLGSWDSVFQQNDKDANNNAIHGEGIARETSDSLLWTTHGMVATLGVSNLAIIQTADATLVCDRRQSENIKLLVSEVQRHNRELTETHRTVHRPWGTYTVLEEGPHFKIKCIVVNPGAKLSMQMHQHRSEHWIVVSGIAKLINGDNEIILNENESTYIPQTHWHRLENAGDKPLSIIEVQCGEYVGEDDIVRFENTYGRSVAI